MDWKLLENELDNLIDLSASGDGAALLDEDAFAADGARPDQAAKPRRYQRKDIVAISEEPARKHAGINDREGVSALTADYLGREKLTEGVGDGAAFGAGEGAEAARFAKMAERLHPGVEVRPPLSRIPNRTYAHVKRAMDIACAALAIVLLLPVLFACAVAVKATSAGPVLFKQERWGRRRGCFECWKFRTMVVETPPDMPAQDFADKAAFMTPVGDFLRRWSLDELPQLVNILKGDMSVVGPRPVIIREERLIDLREPLNADAVRPGLTGWAQVNGRNLVDDEEKAFLDGEYVANMSLAFDARVFFRTLATVVSRRGVDRGARCDDDRVPF